MDPAGAVYRGLVPRNHQRFELLSVTLGGTPLGNATIDVWEDDRGQSQWSARLLLTPRQDASDGLLKGVTREGRPLEGDVFVAATHPVRNGSRAVLVELHGRTPLLTPEGEPR